MAFNPTTGQWTPEDDSVATRVNKLTSGSDPFITQARTQANQVSNRRGLLNSSMAVQAGESAAYGAAIPVASQDAAQTHAKNLAGMQLGTQEKIAGMNVAAHDRQYAISAVAELEKKYGALFTDIQKNTDIDATARNKYYQHISALRDNDLQLVEQLYGIDLDWDTASVSV